MQHRRLGKNGPFISALGLGCMGMTGNYEADINERESIKIMEAAWEAGINFFDTTDMYGNGENEKLVGKSHFEMYSFTKERVCLLPQNVVLSRALMARGIWT